MFMFSCYKLRQFPISSFGRLVSVYRFTFHFASSVIPSSHSSTFSSSPLLSQTWCSCCSPCLPFFNPTRLSPPHCIYNCLISTRAHGFFHHFCSSIEFKTKHNSLGFAELVARNEPTLESALATLKISFTVGDVASTFELLNSRNISGMRFFRWIRLNQQNISRSCDVCSFVVNNCGLLEDYISMASILKELSVENICLTKQAFFFLISSPTHDSLDLLTERMVDILREAGGSCYSSGIHALVDAFSSNGLFSMAKYVIEHSDGKSSHFSVLIKEMCKRNQVKEAKILLNELHEERWAIPPLVFNYIISHQCKVDGAEAWKSFEEMKAFNCDPDAITFEILITHLCKNGKIEDALKMAREMEMEPRLSTHIFVIKAIFKAGKHEKAHEYVLSVGNKQANAVYSLLVKLHRKKGDFVKAKDIIFEMMEKGMVPESSVFFEVLKGLRFSGKTHLASLLKEQFVRIVK